MRRSLAVGLLLGLVATATGCELHAVPFDDPSPRSFVLPRLLRQCIESFADAPSLVVGDEGAEPRRQLRLVPDRPGAGSEGRGSYALAAPAKDAPTRLRESIPPAEMQIEHVLDLEWQARGARGQHCYQFVLRGALAAQSEEETGPVMGVLGVGRQGAITVSADALDDASYAIEGELLRRVGMVQALLPEQPVGVGATWRHQTDGHLRSEYVRVTADFELLAHEGSRVRLAFRRHLVRPEQTVRGRKGGGTRVDEIDEHVRGVIEFDLVSSPLPTVRLFDANGREIEQTIVAWQG
jgi:hypothetical protein